MRDRASILLAVLAILAPGAVAGQQVELQLSLVIDSSGSIDADEYDLQVGSYADIIRDPEIIPRDGTVALNAVFFSDTMREAVPWTVIESGEDADGFADALERYRRISGATAVGEALVFAADLFEPSGLDAQRRVIDISGDGTVNHGRPIEDGRAHALAIVDVINGLPIDPGSGEIAAFYEEEVIGGPGAFSIVAESFEAFYEAVRTKVQIEVHGCARVYEGAVAWFDLNERTGPAAKDEVSGAHGAHVDCPRPVEGAVFGALEMDGGAGHVLVPAHPALATGTGDFSVTLWLRSTGSAGENPVLDIRSGVPVRGWAIGLQDGAPFLVLADGSGTGLCDFSPGGACSRYTASAGIADGAWHHLAVTVDRDEPDGGRFWVDGAPAHTFDPTGRSGSLDGGADLLLGRSHPFPDPIAYEGRLDEVQIYGLVLEEEHVAGLAGVEIGACSQSPCDLEDLIPGNCLWPPNHKYVCYTGLFDRLAHRGCTGYVLELASCSSSQPDDAREAGESGPAGDGATADDCVISDDRDGFCVRSERLGNCPAGRTYTVSYHLADECGFGSGTSSFEVFVPHDQRNHPECEPIDPHAFLGPNEPLPFPWTPVENPDADLPQPFVCP